MEKEPLTYRVYEQGGKTFVQTSKDKLPKGATEVKSGMATKKEAMDFSTNYRKGDESTLKEADAHKKSNSIAERQKQLQAENEQIAKELGKKANEANLVILPDGRTYDPKTEEVVYDNAPGSPTAGQAFIRKKGDKSVGSDPSSSKDTAIKAKDVGEEQKKVERANVGKSTAQVAQDSLTANDVLKMNNYDPVKVRDWLKNHPDFVAGKIMKGWLESNPVEDAPKETPSTTSTSTTTETKTEPKKEPESIFDFADETLNTASNDSTTSSTSSALEDTKAEEEALSKKNEALKGVMKDAKLTREELDEEWDKLLADTEDELNKHEDASNLSEFLPRFAIQHYLQGDFGKKGTAKAIGTLGYFLLDKIGTSLVNASMVARGMTPSQKTALEEYNNKVMENAISRDDKTRSKINEEKINNVIKNSDALRQAGYDTNITLGNDMVSKYLSQHADQINEQVYLKLKKQSADWYDKLSDAEKMQVDRLFLAESTNPDDRQKSIFKYQALGYEAKAQEDVAKAEQAKYAQEEAKEKAKTIGKLTDLQVKKTEQEIENMKQSGLLTNAQVADAWKMVGIHQKDLDWRDAQEWQKQITGYIGAIK